MTRKESIEYALRVAQEKLDYPGAVNSEPRTDHAYVTHHTYTGKGCATCGRPEEEHAEGKKVTDAKNL